MQEELFEGPSEGPGELDTQVVGGVDPTIVDVVAPIELDPDRGLPPDVPSALDEIEALRSLRAAAEAREFALVGHTAVIATRTISQLPGAERLVDLGGDGCPSVPEFAVLEVAGLLRCSHVAARGMVADSLSVRWRHPHLWRAVMDGRTPVWQARKVAQRVRSAGLDRAQALRVDRAVAPALGAVSVGRLEKLVEGEIVAADPERAREKEERARQGRHVTVFGNEPGRSGVRSLLATLSTPDALALDATLGRLAHALLQAGDTEDLDVRRARALGMLATPERALALLVGDTAGADRLKHPVRLYIHLNADRLGPEGVARLENEGAVPVEALRELLADSVVRVTGVIDHRDSEPVDAYEIPERMREQMCLAQPYEVFPWGTRAARHTDLDHTLPYEKGGRTEPGNLGPLGRFAHRAKTHAGWRCRQIRPGRWLWRSPMGREYDVDNWGTHTRLPAPAVPSLIEDRVLMRVSEARTAPDLGQAVAGTAAPGRTGRRGRRQRVPRAGAGRAAHRRRRRARRLPRGMAG